MPPSPSSTTSKAGSDDNATRMSEAALRKKKNADAQAAFRARRANYIATLEETVTNLEAVVIQLQDSCREAKREASDLRSENVRLKQEARHREKLLKRFWQGKVPDLSSDPGDDFPPAPPYSVHPPSTVASSMSAGHVGHYADDSLRYPSGSDQSPSLGGSSYHGNGQDFPQRSPALGFVDTGPSGEGRSQHMDSHRITRYDQYSYSLDSSRDGPWLSGQSGQAASDAGAFDSGSSSHSPTFVESPILTSSELGYPGRFSIVEDQKLPLAALNSSYMFPSSRSISPAASTPTSTSSASLASAPFQFTFPEGNIVQDRPEFAYRRHAPELTLHGGTADIPIAAPGGDAVRYRLPTRSNTAPERPIAQALSSYSRTENGSGGRESDESESPSYTYSTRSRARSTVSSARASRSPSPGPPPICGTLAVIKAQAFGALRRTRTRSKKSSEGAAKAAVEALEARGIGMGITVGSAAKRARLHIDDDMQL